MFRLSAKFLQRNGFHREVYKICISSAGLIFLLQHVFLVCIDILPHGNISSSHSFPHGLVSSHQQNLLFPSVELSFTSSHQWNLFLLLVELYSHWSMLEQSLWQALIGFCPLYLRNDPETHKRSHSTVHHKLGCPPWTNKVSSS